MADLYNDTDLRRPPAYAFKFDDELPDLTDFTYDNLENSEWTPRIALMMAAHDMRCFKYHPNLAKREIQFQTRLWDRLLDKMLCIPSSKTMISVPELALQKAVPFYPREQ